MDGNHGVYARSAAGCGGGSRSGKIMDCAGFHSHGMALAFQSAEALVQLLLGRKKEVHEWLPKCYQLSRVRCGVNYST